MVAVDSNLVVNPNLYPNVNYDPFRDFTPISVLTRLYLVLVGSNKLPARNVAELIAYAKANPGKLNYASIGLGTQAHLGMEMFKLMTKTDIAKIDYRGTNPAMMAIVANEADIMFTGPPSAKQMSEAGQLKVLAVSAPQKGMRVLPAVPTVAESGVPGYYARRLVRYSGARQDAEAGGRPVCLAEVRKATAGRALQGSARRARHGDHRLVAGGNAGDDAGRHQEVGRGHQADRRQDSAIGE